MIAPVMNVAPATIFLGDDAPALTTEELQRQSYQEQIKSMRMQRRWGAVAAISSALMAAFFGIRVLMTKK